MGSVQNEIRPNSRRCLELQLENLIRAAGLGVGVGFVDLDKAFLPIILICIICFIIQSICPPDLHPAIFSRRPVCMDNHGCLLLPRLPVRFSQQEAKQKIRGWKETEAKTGCT